MKKTVNITKTINGNKLVTTYDTRLMTKDVTSGSISNLMKDTPMLTAVMTRYNTHRTYLTYKRKKERVLQISCNSFQTLQLYSSVTRDEVVEFVNSSYSSISNICVSKETHELHLFNAHYFFLKTNSNLGLTIDFKLGNSLLKKIYLIKFMTSVSLNIPLPLQTSSRCRFLNSLKFLPSLRQLNLFSQHGKRIVKSSLTITLPALKSFETNNFLILHNFQFKQRIMIVGVPPMEKHELRWYFSQLCKVRNIKIYQFYSEHLIYFHKKVCKIKY